MTCPGIVPATNYIIQRFSRPGDKVLIQTPVYYAFARSITLNGRSVADNPLKIVNNRYEMDFDDLLLYLHENFIYLKKQLGEQLPGVRVFDLEGTYLAWVDLRPLGLSPEKIIQRIEGTAKVAPDRGDWFGENGAGFERVNLACPRSILEKAVEAMVAALKS